MRSSLAIARRWMFLDNLWRLSVCYLGGVGGLQDAFAQHGFAGVDDRPLRPILSAIARRVFVGHTGVLVGLHW